MSHTKKTLTLHEKIQIIEAIERQKMPVRAVAAQFGIGKTQAAIIIKNKEIIKYKWNSGVHPSEKKVHFRSDGFIIDQLCWAWYAKSKGEGEQVTGQMIKAKGKEIAEELGNLTFKASDGWLQKWRKRHCITSRGDSADYHHRLVEPYLSPSEKQQEFSINQYETENLEIMTQKQQYNHMNNLIPAATTNLSMSTMDIDSLLTPLGSSTSPRSPSNEWQRSMDQRPERNLWRIEEIMEMLNTMQDLHALELLNDKTVKSETVFREVEMEMKKKGYCKKSHVQIWTKWKFLKSTYTTSKRAGITPKMIAPQVYDMLHNMLTTNNALLMSRSQSSLRTDISESGNSLASINDDSDNSSRIVISSIESKYNAPPEKVSEEKEEESGLAHPIFGFRLGSLVKQEPIDNDYDQIQNEIIEPDVQVQASTSNLKFRTNFKNDSLSSPSHLQNDNNLVNIRNRFTTSGPTSSSTPNHLQQNSTTSTKNNLPVLRIAPFAKDPTPVPHHRAKETNHELRICNVRTATSPELNPMRNSKSYKMQTSENRHNPQATNVSQLRLKHTPLRKTPIPEHAVSESAKHYREMESDADYMPYRYGSDVSYKLKKRAHEPKMDEKFGKKRKRSSIDNSWSGMHNDKNDTNGYFEDDDDDDTSSDDVLFNTNLIQNDSKSSTRIEALFGNLLKSFQKSLYNLQHEMMNQFVVNQMQLVRKEHEFQMKQDAIIMSSMKKQSDSFWANAKKFLRTEVKQHYKDKNEKTETDEKACQTEKNENEEEESICNTMRKKNKKKYKKTRSLDESDIDSESDNLDEISEGGKSENCMPPVCVIEQVQSQSQWTNMDGDEDRDGDRDVESLEQMNKDGSEEQQIDNDYEEEEGVEELNDDNHDYEMDDNTNLRPIGDLLQCSLDY